VLSVGSTGYRRAAEEKSAGPTLARRGLAARLGATRGSSPLEGAVHPGDAAALLKAAAQWTKVTEFYNTLDERKLLDTWDGKRPCLQWFGVTCDSTTGRVTAIKLPGLGNEFNPFFVLGGPFPAELGSLPELRSLRLGTEPPRLFGLDPQSLDKPQEAQSLGPVTELPRPRD